MKYKAITGIMLTLLFIGMLTLAFNIQPVESEPTTIIVPDDYPTIQEAINAASDGDTIFVRADTYYEHVVVNKSVSLIGESRSNTIINGNYTGNVIEVTVSNVNITEFTMQNSGSYARSGIDIWMPGPYTNNYNISHNIITNNYNGIFSFDISFITISDNIITNNSAWGIRLTESHNYNITGNNITNNYDGIWLEDSANYINTYSIYGNNITANTGYGIWLTDSSSSNKLHGNSITNNWIGISWDTSDHNSIFENDIADNYYGILFGSQSSDNFVYHNNFVNNTEQVAGIDSANTWDDSYPSGGNFWSHYTGEDLYSGPYSPSEIGSDGIGDTPYIIDENNIDWYPLMGMFSNFSVTHHEATYHITTVCNSTIADFQFNDIAKTISFNVTGEDGTLGFCRIDIPNIIIQNLWKGNYIVLVDGEQPLTIRNWTWWYGTYTYIYFTYLHSEHEVIIAPAQITPPVGGIYVPVNKLGLLAPYIGLTILLAVAVITVGYVKKKKRHTEINS